MKQISHQEPHVNTSVTTIKATHTFSVTSAQISATDETFTVSAPTVQVKYDTDAGGRNGIRDTIKFRPTINNISKSDSAFCSTDVKALNYNTNLSMFLISSISWSFNTADVFNENNPTVRAVSINWPYEIRVMETGKMDGTAMQVIGRLDRSGTSVIPITGTLSEEGSVTLNAPPTFDSSAEVTFNTPIAYARYTTATISISDLSAKYGGDIASVVLKIGNNVSESITTDGTLSLLLTEVGKFTPQIIVTDSRGQITTKDLTEINVKEYTSPSVMLEDINRTNSNGILNDEEGTSAVLTAKFNYLDDLTSLIQPALAVKETDGTILSSNAVWYQNWNQNTGCSQQITDWSTIQKEALVYALITDTDGDPDTGLFSTQRAYQINVTPKDEYEEGLVKSIVLGGAFYTIDILAGGHGIAFGQPATKEGFYCSMDSYIHIDPNDDAGLYQALQALDPTMFDSENMAPLKTILFKALTWG